MSRPNLILVDGTNMFYRSFFAVKYNKVYTNTTHLKRGFLEVHVLLRSILANVSPFTPFGIMVFWDYGKSEFRERRFAKYKANRQSNRDPHDLRRQVFLKGVLKEFLPKLGIFDFGWKGVEADDLIAYLYGQLESSYNIIIMSNDNDLAQFPGTTVCDLSGRVFNVDDEASKRTILSRVVCGDRSDNIGGIGGYGKVKFDALIKNTGLDYEAVLGTFSQDQDKIRTLMRNRELVDLMASNDQIVTTPVRRALRKSMIRYLRRDFAAMEAMEAIHRLGLKQLSQRVGKPVSKVLKGNHERTYSIIRHALRSRIKLESGHGIIV